MSVTERYKRDIKDMVYLEGGLSQWRHNSLPMEYPFLRQRYAAAVPDRRMQLANFVEVLQASHYPIAATHVLIRHHSCHFTSDAQASS